jgi:hypothetical protein
MGSPFFFSAQPVACVRQKRLGFDWVGDNGCEGKVKVGERSSCSRAYTVIRVPSTSFAANKHVFLYRR